MTRTALTLLAMLALAGCHRVRIDAGRPSSGERHRQTVHFYFWGLVGDRVVKLDELCPKGIARFGSEATASQALIQVATLGIWAPRQVTVECAEEAKP